MSTSHITVFPERRLERPAIMDWLALGPPQPISPEIRAANLAAINQWLDANELGPALAKLFDWTKGEDEIVTILDAVDFGWYTDVTFATIRGDGTRGIQQSSYNVNSKNGNGAVLIPAIRFYVGDKYVYTKYLVELECRPTIGRYLLGCLRGFAHPADDIDLRCAVANDDLASLPIGPDELRVCAVLAAVATRIEPSISVGPFFENSGRMAGSIQAYVVAMDIVLSPGQDVIADGEQPLLRRLKQMFLKGKKHRLFTEEQLKDEVYRHPGQPVVDGATAAALWLANNHSWSLPRPRKMSVLR